ncbi:acetyl-CoA acetyltransferase, partial [Rhodococcus sp. IITR03]
MTDPTRVPVVIGVGDLRSGRAGAPADPREPLDLIHEATLAAIADSGADLATRIDTIHAIKTASWNYDDLPGLLAERLARGARTHVDHADRRPLAGGLLDRI